MTSSKRWQILSLAAVGFVLSWTWLSVWRSGYKLVGDTAVVALRAHDVFGSSSPLLGMPSAFSSWSNLADPAHPGPLVFWVLAPAARLIGGAEGALLGTFSLAALSTIWIVLATSRRLGKLGAPAAAIAVLAACRLGSFTIWEPINPTMAVLPGLALCFAVWSVLDGEDRSWPWLIAAASFVIQADLSFLPSAVVLVALAAAVTTQRWAKAYKNNPAISRQIRSVIGWSIGVLGVLWALPVGEALANNGGNLLEGWKASRADVEVLGASAAVRVLVFMLAPAVLLSPLLVISWKRNLPSRRPLAITALVASVGAALGQAMVPSGDHGSLVWVPFAVAAVFVFFATAVLSADIAAGTGPRRGFRLGIGVWVLLLATSFSTVRYLPHQNPFGSELFPAVEPLAAAVGDLQQEEVYLRPLSGPRGTALGHAISEELTRRGVKILVEEPLARYLGAGRRLTKEPESTLYVTLGTDVAPVAGATRIGHWDDAELNHEDHELFDSQLAAAARSAPPRWTESASTFFVGSIVATETGISDESLGDEEINTIGKRMLSGRDDPWKLPNSTIHHLVADGQLLLPDGYEQLQNQAVFSKQTLSVSLWLTS